MPADPTLILDVPAAIRETVACSRDAGRPLQLRRPAPFPVAVIGPPGSGKTTILRALHGGQVPRDGLMSEWNARLVEYPALERAADLRGVSYAGLWRDQVGVLYVLPSRGLNDEDEQALEILRARNVIALENIRDSELHPARASLVLLERPEIGCPFTVPIAPLMAQYSATAMPQAERRLLRHCVAFLRNATLPDGYVPALHEQAMTAREAMRADIEDQWRQVLVLARSPAHISRIDGVRLLLDLLEDCRVSAAFDARLTELIGLLERGGSASSARLLREQAQAAADRYNIEAGHRPAPAAARLTSGAGHSLDHGAEGGATDFGARYVQERQQLLGFLGNVLAQRSQLRLINEEQQSIERLVLKVDEDNIDIALLGRFSSGKSSVINALLGAPIDDRNPALLPTDVRPETSTVNRVCYSANGEVAIEWLARAEVTFATQTSEPGQLRLHGDEIRSFQTWLASGQVADEHVTFTPLPDSFGDYDRSHLPREADQRTAFDAVWQDLGFPDGPRFVYAGNHTDNPKLPDPWFPASATIDPLPEAGTSLRAGAQRAEVFAAVKKDASLALLIDRLNIGFDHRLLRHASFIDTPGTDAPIPHHRRVAQDIVRQQNCPVIYCFLGDRPGGMEDTRNLRILRDWGIGSTNLNRFFFVITMKHNVADDSRETVRDYVRHCLREIGISEPPLYFVDVVHYPDDEEFRALKADVERFINMSRSELFGSWLAQARAIVTEARARSVRQLEDDAKDELQRARRIAVLQRQRAAIEDLAGEHVNSTRWGAPWARGRVESVLAEKAGEVTSVIDGLTARRAFDDVQARLSDALAELNRSTRATLTTIHTGLLGRLQSAVAEIRPGTSIYVSKVTIDTDLFPGTAILEATRNLYWRNIFKRGFQRVFGGEDFNADIGRNSEKIAQPWRKSRESGTTQANSLIDESVKDMKAELNRISASIKAELDEASRPPSSPDHKAELERACSLAAEWLSRLDALGRQAEGSS